MKYFGIRELIPCIDGHCRDRRCGYDESTVVKVPSEVIENAIALVENVLDPLREEYGHPIRVNSGYRCPLKNKAVGGVENSQHLKGEAADICAMPLSNHAPSDPRCGLDPQSLNLKLARILAEQGKFDQMILYVDNTTSMEPRFIHVSHKRSGMNRHRILKKVAGQSYYTEVKGGAL